MSDAQAQNEPTMEEILSSIRRIISEDDEPQASPPAEEPVAEEPEPEAEEPKTVEEILQVVKGKQDGPDGEAFSDQEPEPEPEPERDRKSVV